MAEETKETQSQQEQSSEQASVVETSGTQKDKGQEASNYEKQYKDTQAELTKASQELADNKQLLDTVSPYVDWGKVQGGEEKPSEEEGQSFIDKKAHADSLKELSQNVDIKLLTLEFRQDNPELKPYESLVGFNLLNNTNKNKPLKQRMTDAVKMTQQFLEKERSAGKEDAEKKAQEAAGAGGLGSAGASSPEKKEVPMGESNEDYIARRKAESRKSRGLI